MGCFNKSLWASFKADIRQCSLALERVSEKLNKKSELMRDLRATIKTTNIECTEKDIAMEYVKGDPSTSLEPYTQLNRRIQDRLNFDLVCANDYVPVVVSNSRNRVRWFSKFKSRSDVIQFTMKRNASSPIVMFVMKVPEDYAEKLPLYSIELTRAIGILNEKIPTFYHAAERAHLLQHVGYLMNFTNRKSTLTNKRKRTGNGSKISHHLVSLILGDDSAAMHELSAGMFEMVEFAAECEDIDIVLDLRSLGNNMNSTRFDAFFDAVNKYLIQEGYTSVHDRRHGTVPTLAAVTGGKQGAARIAATVQQQHTGLALERNKNGYAPPFISVQDLSRKVVESGLLTVQIQFLLNQQLHWDFGPHIHQERQQTGSLER